MVGGCVQIGAAVETVPSGAEAQSERSTYRSAEALRHPKARLSAEFNGAAQSPAPS
jgi:hypothetical protein